MAVIRSGCIQPNCDDKIQFDRRGKTGMVGSCPGCGREFTLIAGEITEVAAHR